MSAEQAGYKATFSAVEVVALMIGRSPGKVGPHHAAVHRMRDDYERGLFKPDDVTCLRSIDSVRFQALGPEIFVRWRDPYLGPDTRPRFEDDPSEVESQADVQLLGPMAVLERQRFRREEVARWLAVNRLPSEYHFGEQLLRSDCPEAAQAMARTKEECDSTEGLRDEPETTPTVVVNQLVILRNDIPRAAVEEAEAQTPATVAQKADDGAPDGIAGLVPSDETPDQRRDRLAKRKSELVAQGHKSPTKQVAEEEGITEARIRQILGKKTGPKSASTAADPFGLTRKR